MIRGFRPNWKILRSELTRNRKWCSILFSFSHPISIRRRRSCFCTLLLRWHHTTSLHLQIKVPLLYPKNDSNPINLDPSEHSNSKIKSELMAKNCKTQEEIRIPNWNTKNPKVLGENRETGLVDHTWFDEGRMYMGLWGRSDEIEEWWSKSTYGTL